MNGIKIGRMVKIRSVNLESKAGFRFDDYEPKVLACKTQSKIIGSNFPEIYDHAQLLDTMLSSQLIKDYESENLQML